MTKKIKDEQRGNLGYGSTYRKGEGRDKSYSDEIPSVLGGQVWKVRPDKKASTDNPCVWMGAGVVKFKNCNNYFDCTTCKYDRGMISKAQKGKIASWQDAMRTRTDLDRVCRHSLTGRIERRACAYNYECAHCDFDQYFEDVLSAKTNHPPTDVHQVKGFAVPMDYHFHNGHSWARIESGGYIRIGLDDFSMKLLGEADAFDLPLIGKELDPDAAGWGLRRKDNTADVLSPVGGVIVEVNSGVRENPRLATDEPYGDGWLFLVRTGNIKKSVKSLMSDTGSLEWINGEVAQLEQMVEEVAGPLAADGGHFSRDIYGNLPDLGWNNLTKAFLKT